MRQKFVVTLDKETKKLTVEEFAELSKENFSHVYTVNYVDIVEKSVEHGKEAVISSLRTDKMFPIYECSELIADAVINIANSDTESSKEVYYDDKDYIGKDEDASEANEEDDEFVDIDDEDVNGEDIDDETADIDDLLSDDKTINASSSIKIADEEPDKPVADSDSI